MVGSGIVPLPGSGATTMDAVWHFAVGVAQAGQSEPAPKFDVAAKTCADVHAQYGSVSSVGMLLVQYRSVIWRRWKEDGGVHGGGWGRERRESNTNLRGDVIDAN